MKTKLSTYAHVCWYVLTEVPGWPDAPARARFARSLPIVFPLCAIMVLLCWRLAVYSPEHDARLAQLRPLVQLDREVSNLQIANSDQEVAKLSEQAAAASLLLLENADALPAFLRELKAQAKAAGWDLTVLRREADEAPTEPGRPVQYLQVRGKMKPLQGNADPFSSLMALLERFSTADKRIDLTRLSIRADDTRWQAVELSLRLACPAVHAKTP